MNTKDILKSTSIIGGSQIVVVLMGMVRAKAVAMLLGPTGTGLFGAFQISTNMLQTLAGLGLGNSAVRDIAQAHAMNDPERLSRTVKTLRWAVFITGLLGMALTLLLAPWLSMFTFGNDHFVLEIRLLSVMVYFNLVREGQNALIQGLRRMKELATMSVSTALISTAISIPLLYFYAERGITYFLIALSASQFAVAVYFTRRVPVHAITMTLREKWNESRVMVKLGVSFMGGALAGVFTQYLIKVFIIRDFSLEAAGLYQAASAVSNLFIQFVLQAMGKDFYPRLSAVAHQPEQEAKLINEQTEIAMLLCAPGLLFTLALAPYFIEIFYSGEHLMAYSILQWLIIGLFMRTISWPMGFLFIARGMANYFFWIQILFNVLHLIFIFLFVNYFGIEGAGMAFFVLYVFHIIFMKWMIHNTIDFQWKPRVKHNLVLFTIIFLISFLVLQFMDKISGAFIVSLLAVFMTHLALKKIMEIMEIKSYSQLFDYMKSKLKKTHG